MYVYNVTGKWQCQCQLQLEKMTDRVGEGSYIQLAKCGEKKQCAHKKKAAVFAEYPSKLANTAAFLVDTLYITGWSK